MITVLAFRHLVVRKVRTAFLLAGFAVGVATMIVLLAVGEAMLVQSRDVALVGGGEVTVLPEGVDLEALRTGALTGMFFGIDRARFVGRVMLGGPRHRGMVAGVTPGIEGKLLYLQAGERTVAVRAGGEVPSQAEAAGVGLRLVDGEWRDTPGDSAWVAPTLQQLYDGLDRFHFPPGRDSTWGEWHYFNLVTGPEEWWYITYLIGGDLRAGRWGGQLLVTHRRPDGGYERFTATVDGPGVRFDTTRADLAIGESTVSQRSGLYFLDGVAEGRRGTLRFQLTVRPERLRYFPPVELRHEDFVSGYVVPGLRATGSGTICVGGDCLEVDQAAAYHDHNWGVWRAVTWEWGAGRGEKLDLLYGGVTRAGEGGTDGTTNPFFLAVVDSLGMRQALRFSSIEPRGEIPVPGEPGVMAPRQLVLTARRRDDWARLEIDVQSVQATRTGTAGLERFFLQMRGTFSLQGVLGGEAISDRGAGFFETYVRAPEP